MGGETERLEKWFEAAITNTHIHSVAKSYDI